ncbi:MAG TPA: glycoside hydrolase family 1 protein [Candidatus Saccharimonadales bacterium]|nr:glycoside hydrolase family 1 protein [Candidatus Saccharimonadales bacterium]
MPEDTKPLFPPDFLWGASTAGHQVEGGLHDQWTVWELHNAAELARTAEHRLNRLAIWPEIKNQAQKPDNYVSGESTQHFNRYETDFKLLKELNLNAFRFSIEWSRIEPQQGRFDQEAINHYRKYLSRLKLHNIEPVMNIWHWTMPVWFAEMGGFKYRRNLKFFERFVELVARELTDGVTYVLTINEPNVYTSYGYLLPEPVSGVRWPPEEKSPLAASRVYLNLLSAHRRAYKILKRHKPSLQIGMASNLANIQAKRPHNILDEEITQLMRYFWDWWFLKHSRRQQDFIGLNYYFTDYYRFKFPVLPDDPKMPASDMGWYMEPEGIYPLLLRAWAHYKKPIIITENGVADRHDEYRRWWIEETIVAMERALSEGVKIKGYFHWSLLDNFEWSYGWWPNFGLVEVDRSDKMKRTIRPSAKWLAGRIKKLSGPK